MVGDWIGSHRQPWSSLGRWHRQIGPWFGGDDSDNDGLGGEAPHDMELWREQVSMWVEKDGQTIPDIKQLS